MTATTDGNAGALGPLAPAASTTPPHTTPQTTAPQHTTTGPAQLEEAAARAVRAATGHLLARQAPEGWWKGDLETNVTMDAEDLLLRRFLGILDPDTTAAAARHIRSRQYEDGTWPTFHGGPADLSATVEAYVALRLAGDRPEDPHMARAAA